MIEEMALRFKVPFERHEEVEKIENILAANNVKYIAYKSTGYYNHEFVVRRSGYTWNNIMKMVNSVYAPRYRKEKTWFNSEDQEVVIV